MHMVSFWQISRVFLIHLFFTVFPICLCSVFHENINIDNIALLSCLDRIIEFSEIRNVCLGPLGGGVEGGR